eukprot:2137792-Karenia_brevis.AAC.1
MTTHNITSAGAAQGAPGKPCGRSSRRPGNAREGRTMPQGGPKEGQGGLEALQESQGAHRDARRAQKVRVRG